MISSCVHLGAREHRHEEFAASLAEARRLRSDIVLIGDLLDMGMFVGTSHTGSVFDQNLNPEEQIEEAVRLLKPLKSQIRCILRGNHEERLERVSSIRANKQVAVALGIPEVYKDTAALLQLGSTKVFVAHGSNQSDFNRVLAGREGMDIVALGHTHQLEHKKVVRRGSMGRREVSLLRCGTYLQEPRYGQMALYPPNPIGAAWVSVSPRGRFVDLGVYPRG